MKRWICTTSVAAVTVLALSQLGTVSAQDKKLKAVTTCERLEDRRPSRRVRVAPHDDAGVGSRVDVRETPAPERYRKVGDVGARLMLRVHIVDSERLARLTDDRPTGEPVCSINGSANCT